MSKKWKLVEGAGAKKVCTVREVKSELRRQIDCMGSSYHERGVVRDPEVVRTIRCLEQAIVLIGRNGKG